MMIKTSISKFALAEEKALKAVTDLHKFPLKADDFSKIDCFEIFRSDE